MVGQSTDIAKEIGDLQGKTAAIGAIACTMKGEDGPRRTDRPDARACVRSAGVFASIPPRASMSGQDCGNLTPLRSDSAVGGGVTNL
jgi:hypothetical protein